MVKPNFSRLYKMLKDTAENTENVQLQNTLKNFENRQEYICRKLNVVTENDLIRISDSFRRY